MQRIGGHKGGYAGSKGGFAGKGGKSGGKDAFRVSQNAWLDADEPAPPAPRGKAGGKSSPYGSRPSVPTFFGAASRKRVMEYLGHEMFAGEFDDPPFPVKGKGKLGKGGRGLGGFEQNQPAKKKKKKVVKEEEDDLDAVDEPKVEEENGEKLPRDSPIWIRFDGLAPDLLAAMSGEAVAICSDGKKPGLYRIADQVISHITGGDGEIEYKDDPNWTEYPEVGEALKAHASAEECYQIGIHQALGIWAVGVGMKKKNRDQATKLALATSIALQTEENGEVLDLEEFPAMAEFLEEAKAAR